LRGHVDGVLANGACAGALGDDGLQLVRLRRRLQERLAADGEPEPSDAVGVDVVAPAQVRKRPEQIGGIRVPRYVPADSTMEFVGSKEEMQAEAKKVPADRETMATVDRGLYTLWSRPRD
jgi:hypothetical protein